MMADSILYNQEVTADMLNSIAIDLGSTSFNGFGTTEKFGANELNKITSDLVSSGILLTGNMCRVIKSEDNIILQDGIIVFNDGAKKKIEDQMVIVGVSDLGDSGAVVYALNNMSAGTCTIEIAESYPTEGDFVKLCTISADGTLQDNRNIARAKIDLSFKNNYNEFSFNIPSLVSGAYKKILTIPRTEWDIHNFILIRDEDYGTHSIKQSATFMKKIDEIEFDKGYPGAISWFWNTDYNWGVKFCEENTDVAMYIYRTGTSGFDRDTPWYVYIL